MTTFRFAGVLFLAVSHLAGAQLTSSTYLRASFTPAAIATDSTGNIYVAGDILLDPLTNQQAVLVLKLNPQGTQYLYETYISGSVDEDTGGIAIDSAGNAYIAGTTKSPDFPLTSGGAFTSPSTGFTDPRPFLVKLSSGGTITLSTIFGGQGSASAVAVASDGNVLVSGYCLEEAFMATPGAYSAPCAYGDPYLIKLDPATPKIMFSATGIGGTSIALDNDGNIFVSGLTGFPSDYPTTPGAYQTQFPSNIVCSLPCNEVFPGPNQYVTKIDPTGSKLIYSTGLNPPNGEQFFIPSGDPNAIGMTNAGLVVDAAGNAYVTGATVYPHYPFTTAPPPNLLTVPFLSKLDPTGSKLLFSVPAGGSGLQLDTSGNLYAAGILYGPVPAPSAATSVMVGLPANFPSQCLPNNVTSLSEGYVQQLDPSTGNVRSAQFIDGSIVSSAVIAPGSEGSVWMSGAISRPDIPFTLNPLFPANLGPAPQPGAYLASVAFSEPTTTPTGPQISCVLDSADSIHAGPIAPNQLLTLMGTNLGPEKGVSAPAAGSTSLAGVTVTFNDIPAKLLYISSSQINVAVPGVSQTSASVEPSSVMQIKVNGAPSSPRLFPVTSSSPSLFTDLFASPPASCTQGYPPSVLARNADGSINSCLQPAKRGSTISLYLNGVGIGTEVFFDSFSIFDFDVVINGASAEVVTVANENDWVTRVDVRLPASLTAGTFNVTVRESGLPVGPLSLTPALSPYLPAGTSTPLSIWVEP
jgi:uncharacterized protein (TIGR03437 family)